MWNSQDLSVQGRSKYKRGSLNYRCALVLKVLALKFKVRSETGIRRCLMWSLPVQPESVDSQSRRIRLRIHKYVGECQLKNRPYIYKTLSSRNTDCPDLESERQQRRATSLGIRLEVIPKILQRKLLVRKRSRFYIGYV